MLTNIFLGTARIAALNRFLVTLNHALLKSNMHPQKRQGERCLRCKLCFFLVGIKQFEHILCERS